MSSNIRESTLKSMKLLPPSHHPTPPPATTFYDNISDRNKMRVFANLFTLKWGKYFGNTLVIQEYDTGR